MIENVLDKIAPDKDMDFSRYNHRWCCEHQWFSSVADFPLVFVTLFILQEVQEISNKNKQRDLFKNEILNASHFHDRQLPE